MKVSVILPAAGLGTRMRPAPRERRAPAASSSCCSTASPILVHTVRKFVACPLVTEIVVALREDDLDWVGDLLRRRPFSKPVRCVAGGDTRQQSVENALAALAPDIDLVAVHDAVRPFVDPDTIDE